MVFVVGEETILEITKNVQNELSNAAINIETVKHTLNECVAVYERLLLCMFLRTLRPSLCVCVYAFECEATPINTVMAHHNFNRTPPSPEKSLPLNQNGLFIQRNRFTINWFIEIAFGSMLYFFVK